MGIGWDGMMGGGWDGWCVVVGGGGTLGWDGVGGGATNYM